MQCKGVQEQQLFLINVHSLHCLLLPNFAVLFLKSTEFATSAGYVIQKFNFCFVAFKIGKTVYFEIFLKNPKPAIATLALSTIQKINNENFSQLWRLYYPNSRLFLKDWKFKACKLREFYLRFFRRKFSLTDLVKKYTLFNNCGFFDIRIISAHPQQNKTDRNATTMPRVKQKINSAEFTEHLLMKMCAIREIRRITKILKSIDIN